MADPYDEQNISDDDVMIRRIDPKQHLAWDDDRKCNRVSTKAFQASTKLKSGMSIDVEKLIQNDEIDPREWVTTPRFRGSVWFPAKLVRNLGLRVGYEPIEEDGTVEANPYHGEVWGPKLDFVQNRPRSEISFVAIWSQAGSRENVIPPKSRHLATDCHIG